MGLIRNSGCKVNLLLNILGKRPDGFHELETIIQPVGIHDELRIESLKAGIELTCNEPTLPVDASNLVYRAATAFLQASGITSGVRIHLEKHIPLAAGLGGGSGNAATTLLGLNDLFGHPLSFQRLEEVAAGLGSDVPFFLQSKPALCTGRGERVKSLEKFPALQDAWILLIHPGFGVSTPWAYQSLARFPHALNGQPGRAEQLLGLLKTSDAKAVGALLYNSLEAPVLEKYPILVLFQEFLRANGALAALMSGSGSTTFALCGNEGEAESLRTKFDIEFPRCWTRVAPL